MSKRPFLLPVQAKLIKRRFSGPRQAQKAVLVNVPRSMPMRASLSQRRNLPAVLRSSTTEIKAIDIPEATITLEAIGTPPTFHLLNGIQVGSGFFNRIGSKIEMLNLHVRGFLVNIATSVQQYGRILIVYDRQPNGAAPAITEVLQSRDQTGTASTTDKSEINLDQRDRFIIVRDKDFFLPSVTNTGGVLTNGPNWPGDIEEHWEINWFIKLKNLLTHFKSSTNPTTVADINTGALYAIFLAGTTAQWAAQVSFRLRYSDL